MNPFVKNAANPEQVKEAARLDKYKDKQKIEDARSVMSTPNGRRFVMSVMHYSGVNRLSFTGNSETYFNEGARNIGLWIQSMLQTEMPDLYLQMIKENIKGEENG